MAFGAKNGDLIKPIRNPYGQCIMNLSLPDHADSSAAGLLPEGDAEMTGEHA